jgi:hypothetical protein
MEAREYYKKIKDDGWYLHDTDGATRQYVKKGHAGFLTICAQHTGVLGPDTAKAALTPATADVDGVPDVVVEATAKGASAYCPDLPGVAATGENDVKARERMSEALALHRRALSGAAPEV